jgi:redox-sensitive bicupin YhaK (pirin superfamily)|tara:strand:- start:24 stop:860 length:837 start_codon:yes stop_codon:yes gene_type:complete
MNAKRNVKAVIPTQTVLEGGGFKVRRPAAMGSLMSPFLLLDEMGPADYGPGEAVGAPWHPHRGFETVTYMLAGEMEHEDSVGSKGVITPGDVQWMTAGKGIIHSEMPTKKMMDEGGLMHGFQIWVNLPAKDKMMNPRYQDITSDQSPTIDKDGVWARVIAGECLGIESSIDTVIPITYVHVKMEPSASLDKNLDTELNGMIYVFKGEVSIEGKSVKDGSLALLSAGSEVKIEAKEESEFLILAGPELNEPIARYGPFVMNTREEILQAIDDYQRGILA